jgi:hypothetical protein
VEWTLLAALAGLALVDSTSIGTLLIPLWMLLEPQLRVRQFFVYLGTVAGFYFVVGVALTAGAGSLREAFAGVGDSPVFNWIQLVVGVGLFALSFWFEPKLVRRRRARSGRPDAATRWRARLSTAEASPATMVGLGLGAAGLEVMSMLPYLAAIGLITAAGVSAAVWLPVLGGYALVMVLPALVLLGVRVALGRRVETPLQVIGAWMSRHADGMLSWVFGIIGFLLARDAVVRLDLIG